MSPGVARERPARRRLPAQERRGQLMDASIRLLARDGFPRTTADAIAAEAGVSKGLIWRHFDDLTDLLHQSGLHALRQITQAVADELDFTAPVPDVIRAAIAVASRVPTRWPEQHRAIQQLTGSLRDSEGALVVSAADIDELLAGQEMLFRKGQSEGDIRPDIDPRTLAITYQAAVDAMIERLEGDPELDPEASASELADLLLDGIRKKGHQ